MGGIGQRAHGAGLEVAATFLGLVAGFAASWLWTDVARPALAGVPADERDLDWFLAAVGCPLVFAAAGAGVGAVWRRRWQAAADAEPGAAADGGGR